ncbi:restriction endonuclease subunit S [Sporolactobacillus sp. STCC-11]|uniref:restriction endonuclease subunit S n=1 Tax=Sporolactobacillus caesalpiniae TaxID=3230362 RepID=UPI003392B2D2
MNSDVWTEERLGDVIEFNPSEKLKRGELAKKIGMDKLHPFYKYIGDFEITKYTGGSKFRNGDTLLARITPCLENGKTAQVTLLESNEVGFGSTEFIVLRKKKNRTVNDYIYYLAISPNLREIAIKSMTGTSGRQRAQTDLIENTFMNVPPLKRQEKIAYILSSLDKKIELNNRINQNFVVEFAA